MIEKKLNIDFKFNKEWILFLFYAFATLVCIVNHEMWRDEAQKWLIARDLGLKELFLQSRYEGHPILWNLILHPFAKLGLSYGTSQVLHWITINLATYLFVFKSKFPFYVKCAFVCSHIMLYEYAIISRNYALCILLLFSIATIFQKKYQFPILFATFAGLLANTHIFCAGVAGAIMLLFIIKSKNQLSKTKLSISIVTFGFWLMGIAFLLWRPQDGINHISKFNESDWFTVLSKMTFGISITIKEVFSFASFVPINWMIALLILIILFIGFNSGKNILFGFIISIMPFFIINTYVYHLTFYHFYLLPVILIFWLWISNLKEDTISENITPTFFTKYLTVKTANVTLFILLLFNDFFNLRYYQMDIFQSNWRYSGGKEMAIIISSNPAFKNKTFVTYPSQLATSVMPYLDKNTTFWFAETMSNGSFIIWKQGFFTYLPPNELISRTKSSFGNKEETLYLLANDYLKISNNKDYFIPMVSNSDFIYEKGDETFTICKAK